MSEATRAAYDAKLDELSRRIQYLENERDALQMLPEDREYYDTQMDPLLREVTRAAVARFAEANKFMATLAKREAEDKTFFVGAQWPKGSPETVRVIWPEDI